MRGRFDLDVPARRAPEQSDDRGEHEESDDDKDHERDHARSLPLNGLQDKVKLTHYPGSVAPMPAFTLRAQPIALAGLAFVGALLAWALFFGGGDSSTRLVWVGAAAVLLAAVAAAAVFDGRVERPRVGRVGAACAGCFAALVVWQGISIVWSVQPDRSWDYVNRGLVYVAFLALGVFVGALVPVQRALPPAALQPCSRSCSRTRSWRRASPRSIPTMEGSRASARRSASGMRSRCSETSRSYWVSGAARNAGSTARCSSSPGS